jgi:protein-tyrosine phosphatase
MAAALTDRLLAERGAAGVTVSSASILDRPGYPATDDTVAVLAGRGIDLQAHRSQTLTRPLTAAADLVLTMERAHLRVAATLSPGAFAKTFTLKEFVRRGHERGARLAGEDLAAYLGRVGAGREARQLLQADPADDVADPQGGPRAGFVATVDELDVLARGLVDLLFGRA